MADRDDLRRALLSIVDVDEPVVIRMRHEPGPSAARLLASLGAGWVVDENAPPCAKRCGRRECAVSVSLPPRHPLSPQKARALARAGALRNGARLEERDPEAEAATEDAALVAPTVPEHSRTASETPPASGRSPSRSSSPVRVGPSERVTLDLVAGGLGRAGEIAAARDINVGAVAMHLKSLHEKGLIVRISRGLYAVNDSSDERAASHSEEEGPRSPTPAEGGSDDQAPGMGARTPGPTPDDDFPDETKDAYATALIAAARAFADTLEEELALL